MFKFIGNGLNTKTFSLQLDRKSSTNINLNTASILSVKVKQHNISVSSSLRNALKEARNSFPLFQSNKHILSLDTVRVIILRRNLARVLSTHRRFLTLYFSPK